MLILVQYPDSERMIEEIITTADEDWIDWSDIGSVGGDNR